LKGSKKNPAYSEFHFSKTEISYWTFGLELGFAVTIHKLQGLTLNKLIIQLNRPPTGKNQMTFEGFLVALSRVRNQESIRRLPILPGQNINYLKELRSPFKLKQWMQGIDSSTGLWNRQLIVNLDPENVANPKRKRKKN